MQTKGKLRYLALAAMLALGLAMAGLAWAAALPGAPLVPQEGAVAVFPEEGFSIELLSFSMDRGTILARFKVVADWDGELELYEPRVNTYLFGSNNLQLDFIASDFNGRPRFKAGIPRAFYIRFVGSDDPQVRYLLTTTFKGADTMDLAFANLLPQR
jgi:hypothetical protein